MKLKEGNQLLCIIQQLDFRKDQDFLYEFVWNISVWILGFLNDIHTEHFKHLVTIFKWLNVVQYVVVGLMLPILCSFVYTETQRFWNFRCRLWDIQRIFFGTIHQLGSLRGRNSLTKMVVLYGSQVSVDQVYIQMDFPMPF